MAARERRARSNRTEPCLSACGVNGGAGDATAEVGGDDCAQEAQPEGAQEVVSTGWQGEAWACRGDQGRARTALGRRHAHAVGAGAYRALLEVVVENVDAIAVVVGRAGGPVRGRAAVKAAEATAAEAMAATAAMMAAAAAVTAVVAERARAAAERSGW